jgi:penicillin-binding protein 2
MVSQPTFDPNDFAVRIPAQEWAALNNNPQTPLLNRTIQAQLAPGSVFKIVMSAAMLESKAVPEDFTVFCPGHANFYGRTFHCWEEKGHGSVDLHKAIVNSCDVFFYTLGKNLGIDRIHHYATGLGLGRRTGIDLPGEETGLIPSEEWVERVLHHKWYAGETISVSIGQGAVTVTPVQMARMVAAVANGGTLVQPHLLKGLAEPKVDQFPLSDSTVEQVTQGMHDVVNEGGGTGYALRLQNVDFCGKTGTAQLMSAEAESRLGRGKGINSGWFVGYAPRRNPEIVVAALVQETALHGGSTAGPVVRDLVKAYYDKRNGHLPQPTTAQIVSPPAPPHPLPAAATGAQLP